MTGATFFIPSEDEWYKGAYHQPSAQGGDTNDYWLYPTASNSVPTIATANATGDNRQPGHERGQLRFWGGLEWAERQCHDGRGKHEWKHATGCAYRNW
jgi:hypothetical protein